MDVTGTTGVYKPRPQRDRIDELLAEAERLMWLGPPPASFAHWSLNHQLYRISMEIADILAVTNRTTVWKTG